jgi:hypothetical protein
MEWNMEHEERERYKGSSSNHAPSTLSNTQDTPHTNTDTDTYNEGTTSRNNTAPTTQTDTRHRVHNAASRTGHPFHIGYWVPPLLCCLLRWITRQVTTGLDHLLPFPIFPTAHPKQAARSLPSAPYSPTMP